LILNKNYKQKLFWSNTVEEYREEMKEHNGFIEPEYIHNYDTNKWKVLNVEKLEKEAQIRE